MGDTKQKMLGRRHNYDAIWKVFVLRRDKKAVYTLAHKKIKMYHHAYDEIYDL